ncbi:MAG: type IV pili methyl-accepting chemotaxis transducer N-terminal domain-containing protein [Azoarcus sp.]|jgi:signal transduction histidine kinase|nr:type IV pili methyl-accepting chemotaxis transducer N-terminal domain-containing protein [Azoarcus sp.]
MDDKVSIFRKYRNILVAVILFVTADALVIGINFYNTYRSDESGVSINLSGRQRMLSQRTTKVLLTLNEALNNDDESIIKANVKELSLAVGLFDTTLEGFRDGKIVTGGDMKPVFLVKVNTEKSVDFVKNTYGIWDFYKRLLKGLYVPLPEGYIPVAGGKKVGEVTDDEIMESVRFIKSNPERLYAAALYAQRNNLKILGFMNDLTTDLEFVNNERAAKLRIVLVAGIIFAVMNFGYTVVVSIRDLMKTDAELAKARGETVEILSTVREGLFLLDKEKKIGTQFSESLPVILRRDIQPGSNFLTHLEAIAPKNIYESAVDYIELLLGDRVKEALVASLNPLTNVPVIATDVLGSAQTRYLSFFFNRVLQDDVISHLLVTVQDVTDKVVLSQQVEQAKNLAKTEIETLLRLASGDFASLQQFIAATGESLAQINEKLSVPHDDVRERLHTLNYIMRVVHGIKGEAAVLGIDVLESYAHECEKEMVTMRESGDSLSGDQMLRIAVLLEGFYQRHSSLAQVVSRLGDALGKTQPQSAAETGASTHPFVGHVSSLAERIATDNGKQIEISCQFEKLFSLPSHVVQELQGISVQLVRNAVTHGIETPQERASRNKPQSGALCLWCEYLGNGQYDFTVRDDGRGIVPARLREHFVKNGTLSASEASTLNDNEIANRLFMPGVSTAQTANKDAGHGIGLDAVLEKVNKMGWHLLVKSRANRYTEFHIQFNTTS